MGVDRARIGRYARAASRWATLLASRGLADEIRVFYGEDRIPGPGEPAEGGTAKFQRLGERFPNSPTSFTLLYLGSTRLPRDLRPLLWLARRRRAPIVLNQDGVAYPGWAGSATEQLNRVNRRALEVAHHVVYQSEFSKRSSDEWLCEPRGTWEILPNAVDVDHFAPGERAPAGGPVFLLGGDQTQVYRLELGLETFAHVLEQEPDARLVVTGRLVLSPDRLLDDLHLGGKVDFVGRYAQRDAPSILRRAHVLLHTKVNDPCPSAVIEAMACGLPVVYPASGGTPELVGEEAGIGVPHDSGWERDRPPTAAALAEAASRVLADLSTYASAARRRAVERFSLPPWLDRHAELFAELRGRG